MATEALVSTGWLAQRLEAPDIRIVDATWFLPDDGRDARAEYETAHIPGAVFFDIDEVSDEHSDLPHMLPQPAKFSSRVRRLGLGDGVRVVVYDANAFFASARVWWMFRVFGHRDVVVLDGGFEKWRAEGHPLNDEPVRPVERHFTARLNNLLIRDLDQVRGDLTRRREQLVDTRSSARFHGRETEPRPGLRGGHIPGSRNVHYRSLIAEDGTLAERELLERAFRTANVEPAAPVTVTCGSGVSAAVAALALHQLGREDVALYDGSWSEWGARSDTPVAT